MIGNPRDFRVEREDAGAMAGRRAGDSLLSPPQRSCMEDIPVDGTFPAGGDDGGWLLTRDQDQTDARGGDAAAAFVRLTTPHHQRLYGIALALCRDRDQAADLTQDALIRAEGGVAAQRWATVRRLLRGEGEAAVGSDVRLPARTRAARR